MKIIAVWPDPRSEVGIFFDVLKKKGHEIVYWVSDNNTEQFCPPGAIFHNHYEAWNGNPAPAYANTHIPPISERDVEKFYEVESISLTMMNKGYDTEPVDSRKHTYYSMLAYWTFVLDVHKPDAIIYNTLPHTVYNYVLYELARARGIRTVLFDNAWFVGRLLPYEDIWNGSTPLKKALAQNLLKDTGVEDLDDVSRGYYERQTIPSLWETPSYMKDQRAVAEGAGLWRHRLRVAAKTLRHGTFFQLASDYVKRAFKKNLRDEYLSLQKIPDLSVPFVYFPLSHQPERTTSPQGGVYHDQILVAETVAAALPEGWKLYIKEHPSQWWRRSKTRFSSVRYPGYYERLARIPGVTLVPISTDSLILTNASRTTATVTGTAGWEALLRGKSPLVFGFVWYGDCPGVTHVTSVDDCKHAFAEISKVPVRDMSKGVFAFLKALMHASVPAYTEDPGDPLVPVISSEQSLRTLATTIDGLLRGKELA